MGPFDAADPVSILRHGQRLVGRTIADVEAIVREEHGAWDARASKGATGRLIERHFGLAGDNVAGPDLRDAGVEIKTVPMVRDRSTRRATDRASKRAKERTSITMIDYHGILDQAFAGSVLDLKTRLVLYVFVLWSADPSGSNVPERVLRVGLHERDAVDVLALTSAYDHVREQVAAGEAHTLSESDTAPVGAATKGAGGKRTSQPCSELAARPRAFAWRPAYTTALFHRMGRRSRTMVAMGGIDDVAGVVAAATARIMTRRGASVEALRSELAPDVSPTSKNVTSVVIRRLLAGTEPDVVAALERLGIRTRVTRVDPATLRPREALSFSPIDYHEVAQTPWEESDVLAMLGTVFFVVLDAPKGAAVREATVRGAAFWQADEETVSLLRREYEAFRRAIARLPPELWPKPSETTALHVRPHGRDGNDVVSLPSGGSHVRSSFWLNQDFVADVLRRAGV